MGAFKGDLGIYSNTTIRASLSLVYIVLRFHIGFLSYFFFLLIASLPTQARQQAQNLFQQYESSLYQIRIIDIESGNKSAIGSGFQIDKKGTIATNYHVVSQYIFYPQKYRIEYENTQGDTGILSLEKFDIINDLAIVKQNDGFEPFLTLAETLPTQGEAIYSLGNPHDLGMIVVPGTFNGIKKNSFYQRIHFTGSINPGMSGGPVLSQRGDIIGVNVATAGNQIGFLIPLPRLKNLIERQPSDAEDSEDYKKHIQQQLTVNQEQLIKTMLSIPWPQVELGAAKIPGQVADMLSCWGSSNNNDPKRLFTSIKQRCAMGEQVFVHQNFFSGEIEMEFELLGSIEVNQQRFYNLLQQAISSAQAANRASKIDVSNFQCRQGGFENQNALGQKAAFCTRAYKDFDGLYDVLYIAATVNDDNQSLISHFTLAGVSQESSIQFAKRFMESASWQ
jgi:hypothetical protein